MNFDAARQLLEMTDEDLSQNLSVEEILINSGNIAGTIITVL